MNRRLIIAIVIASVLVAPLEGRAQPARVRIGMLELSTPDPARVAWWDAFRQRMRELGYIEGQNVTFEDASRMEGSSAWPHSPPSSSR